METTFSRSGVFSLALIVIAAVWISKYGSARNARKYLEERKSIARDESFKTFGKVIFLFSNLLTLASFFWQDETANLRGGKSGLLEC